MAIRFNEETCCETPEGEGIAIDARAANVALGRVETGQHYRFEARGTWVDWYIRTDAGGYDSRFAALFGLWPDVRLKPLMALCGRLMGDDNREYLFVIGRERGWIAPVGGELGVFANDVTLHKWFRDNNRGEITLWMRAVDCTCPPEDDEVVVIDHAKRRPVDPPVPRNLKAHRTGSDR